jgi:F420H(2)-dependent quinone reductase
MLIHGVFLIERRCAPPKRLVIDHADELGQRPSSPGTLTESKLQYRTKYKERAMAHEAAQHGGREFSPQFKKAMRAFSALHVLMYRVTRGRMFNRISGAPVLLLTTIGRKTGKRRTRPLVHLRDGDRFVVVGSAGGAKHDPTWVLNLRANGRVLVEVGGRRQEMIAQVVTGAERDRLWPRLIEIFPGFGEYQHVTPRELPVIVLNPIRTSNNA